MKKLSSVVLLFILVFFVQSSFAIQRIDLNFINGTYNPFNQNGINDSKTLNTKVFTNTVDHNFLVNDNALNPYITIGSWSSSPAYSFNIDATNPNVFVYLKRHSGPNSVILRTEVSGINFSNGAVLFTEAKEEQFVLTTGYVPYNITLASRTYNNNTYINVTLKIKHSSPGLDINASMSYNSNQFRSRFNFSTAENIVHERSYAAAANESESSTFSTGQPIHVHSLLRNKIGIHDSNVIVNVYNNSNISQLIATNQSVMNRSNGYNTNFTSIMTLNQPGVYSFSVIASDLSGNTQEDAFLVSVVSPPTSSVPIFSSDATSPSSPTIYSPGKSYQFSSVVTDPENIHTVLLEFDGRNYTTSKVGDNYTATITDIKANATGYTYKWHANDTLGNRNSTNSMTYIVNRAPTSITVLLNDSDSNRNYISGQHANITAIINTTGKTISLFRNGTSIGSGITRVENITNTGQLSIGDYNFSGNWSGDENYTSSSSSNIMTVSSIGAPTITNTSASPSSPSTYDPSATYQFNASITDSNGIGTVLFEFNGLNRTPTNIGSVYSYTMSSLGANASGYSYRWHATNTLGGYSNTAPASYIINPTATNMTLLFNGSNSDRNYVLGQHANVTAIINITGKTISLYRNNTFISNGTTRIEHIADTSQLGLGSYMFLVNWTGDNNYTISSSSHTLTVSATGSPSISNIVSSPDSPTTYEQGRVYQFNSTVTDANGVNVVSFEFNGTNRTPTANGNVYSYNILDLPANSVGYIYRWHASNVLGGSSSSSVQSYVINKATTSVTLTMNGTSSSRTYFKNDVANLSAWLNITGRTVDMYANFSGSYEKLSTTGTNIIQNITSPLSIGNYMVISNWSGDENYTFSQSTGDISVVDSNDYTEPSFSFNSSYSNFTEGQNLSFELTMRNTGNGTLNNSYVQIIIPSGWSNSSSRNVSLGNFSPNETKTVLWYLTSGSQGVYNLTTKLNGYDNRTNAFKEYRENYTVHVFSGAAFNITEIYNNNSDPFYLNLTVYDNGSADMVNVTATVNFTSGLSLYNGSNSSYDMGDINSSQSKNVSWKFNVSQSGNVTYTINGTDKNSLAVKSVSKTIQVTKNQDGGGSGGSGGSGGGGSSDGSSGGSSGGSGGGGGGSSTVTVKSDPFLFDIKIDLPRTVLIQGDPFNVSVTLIKMQGNGLVDATLTLEVVNESGQIIWKDSLTVAVMTQKIENVLIPTGTFATGKYFLRGKVEYPNAVATAEKTFKVISLTSLEEENEKTRARILEHEREIRALRIGIIASLIIIAVLVTIVLVRKNDKKIHKYLDDIAEHLKMTHVCRTCGSTFREYNQYEEHLKTHSETSEKDWGN